eukprot:m.4802 g.4802  ORF g.4802 m.4802 type:complete len:475 (-) comp3183_c0_seq1:47-1471(-)
MRSAAVFLLLLVQQGLSKNVMRFTLVAERFGVENTTGLQRERRAPGEIIQLPITGIPSLIFSLNMTFGTPSQVFTIALDTGSSNLAVAASSNANAPSFFNTGASSSYNSLTEVMTVFYLKGQWTGLRSQDVINFQGSSKGAVSSQFSAITSSSDFFPSGVTGEYATFVFDGILGLGYSALARPSSNPITPFLDTYMSEHTLDNMFTLQLCDFRKVAGNLVTRTGQFVIGGDEADVASLASGSFLRVNIVQQSYYSVVMTGLSVGGTRLDFSCRDYNSPNYAIFDSGSTNLILPNAIVEALQARMPFTFASSSDRDTFYGGGSCAVISDSSLSSFPDLTVHVQSATSGKEVLLTVKPWQYLRATPVSSVLSPGQTCRVWGVSASCATILGVVVMDGYVVLHDRVNQQLAIAASTCAVQVAGDSPVPPTQQTIPGSVDMSQCSPDSGHCASSAEGLHQPTTISLLAALLLALVLAA